MDQSMNLICIFYIFFCYRKSSRQKSEMLFVFVKLSRLSDLPEFTPYLCSSLDRALLSALYLADIVLPCQASASTFVKIAIKINQTFTVPVGLRLRIEHYTTLVQRGSELGRARQVSDILIWTIKIMSNSIIDKGGPKQKTNGRKN